MVQVAPFMGAWIEIPFNNHRPLWNLWSHPSWVRGLKCIFGRSALIPCRSHPSWVRGLKSFIAPLIWLISPSHPSWVRGLKSLTSFLFFVFILSHPSWVRGLKCSYGYLFKIKRSRTLHGCVDWNKHGQLSAEAIEKSHPSWVRGLKWNKRRTLHLFNRSHPSWVRGLKLFSPLLLLYLRRVAPFMGAWIEIQQKELTLTL